MLAFKMIPFAAALAGAAAEVNEVSSHSRELRSISRPRPSRGLRARARNLSPVPADLVAQLKEQLPESACEAETEDAKAIECYKAEIAAQLNSMVAVDADGELLDADGFTGKRSVSGETLIYAAGNIKPAVKISETFNNLKDKAWPMLYNWVTGSEPEEGQDFTWDDVKGDLAAFAKAVTFGAIKIAKNNAKVEKSYAA